MGTHMPLIRTFVVDDKNKVAHVTDYGDTAVIVITRVFLLGVFRTERTYKGRRNEKDCTYDWYYRGKLCISNEWAELNCLIENRKFL